MAKKHARADGFVAFKSNNVRIMNEMKSTYIKEENFNDSIE